MKTVEATSSIAAEAQWVRQSQLGDHDAFGRLVRLYQRRVVSLAYRLLGNSEDAADVAQEAFVRAYRGIKQLEDPARFGPWIYRIVSNLALNYRRSRNTRNAAPLADPAGSEGRIPGSGRSLVQSFERQNETTANELHTAIDEAMEQLPDKQRLALILFSVEGLAQQEVAEILGCSTELVKWNVFQARKKLKELLEPLIR